MARYQAGYPTAAACVVGSADRRSSNITEEPLRSWPFGGRQIMLNLAHLLARILIGGAVLGSAPAMAGSPLTEGPSPSWGYGYEVPAYAYPYGYLGYRHGRPTYSV